MSNLERLRGIAACAVLGRNECGLDDAGDNGPGGEGKGKKGKGWKGQRHGQTTSLDEIEPLEPQRAHHTIARAASPHTSHSPPLRYSAHYRSLPLPTAACRLGLPCSAALSLSCPAHTGLALAVGMTQIGTGNLLWLAG